MRLCPCRDLLGAATGDVSRCRRTTDVCAYEHSTCLFVDVPCISVNACMPVVFCIAHVSHQGSAPLSCETRSSRWNLGLFLGSCLITVVFILRCLNQVSRLCLAFVSSSLGRIRTRFWVGTSQQFYLLGWAGRLPENGGGSVGEVSTLPLSITLAPLFSPVHFNRIYA